MARSTILATIRDSRNYVLAEAQRNVEFIKANPAQVAQAHQINAALANIVAMERNIVMDKAVERALKKDEIVNLPQVPVTGPRARPEPDPAILPPVLEPDPAGTLGAES